MIVKQEKNLVQLLHQIKGQRAGTNFPSLIHKGGYDTISSDTV